MTQGTMQAAVFRRTGAAEEVLRIREVPIPTPGHGEVLVRVRAASINPADRMFIEGRYRVKPQLPQVAGLVGSGTLVDGDPSRAWPAGTRVAFRRAGAWAEYCCVPLNRLYRVPEHVDELQACQFALNPLTAWGLLDVADVREGDWLAVNAGGSNVARLTRALANARGIRLIAIHRALPADAGSTDIPDGEQIAGRLMAIAGKPISALLDCVGGSAITEVIPALAPGATIVSYGTLGSDLAMVSNADMVYRNLRWTGFGIDRWLDGLGPRVDDIVNELWSAASTLPKPSGPGVYPLAEIERALLSSLSSSDGKTILSMSA